MKSVAATCLCVSAVMLAAAIEGGAQQRPADPNDPRVGLKAGLRDAGEAARNMKKISSLPKPEGFFDPANPGGTPIPPERDPNLPPRAARPIRTRRPAQSRRPTCSASRTRISRSRATTSSWAASTASPPTTSSGRPSRSWPRRWSAPADRATCRSTATCCSCRSSRPAAASTAARRASSTPVSAERFRGVRIFDISDINKPKQVAAVQTCRGSHTHTLVTDPNDKANLYVYGSGTSGVRSGEELAGCSGAKSPTRIRTPSLFSIDVIQVPIAAPQNAQGRQPPRIFADTADRQHRRPQQGRRQRPRHAEDERDQPVPRHHGVPGSRPGRRRLLGQRHPARHPRSEEPEAARRRVGQELRLLALGDVQQRRHQGDLHRRVGRRRAAALPRHRSAQLGRRRDLRHRRSASWCSRATTRCRRRRPSRRTASRTTAR